VGSRGYARPSEVADVGIDHLVFGSGDLVTGWGWLRGTEDGVWFDPGRFHDLLFREQPMSRDAVRLHGADLGAVATEYGPDGSIPGWATITGVWLGDAIEVRHQSPRRPGRPRSADWTRPPCPPPAGGWPTGMNGGETENLTFDLGDLQDTGAAVTVVIFRPGQNQAVLVVAASDPAAVESRLRPQLGPRLCVVSSRWTKDQLDAASATLREHIHDWKISSFGHGVDHDGQAVVEVTVLRVLPEMAHWATGLPDGLPQVIPVLAPVAR
jgi:hypothetical protein